MKFAIDFPIPPVQGCSAETIVEWGVMAEEAGWDAICLWNHLSMFYPEAVETLDAWVLYSAIAARTKRIKLGPIYSPLSRRRPWKVARESVTLDHLSNGRVIMAAILGYPPDGDFGVFGEVVHAKTRAERLDEGLEILTGLWTGEPFAHEGQHYHLEEMTFLPKPVQTPRIPIWVGGTWPNKAPFRRAAEWDGVAPIKDWPAQLKAEDLQEILEYIESYRGNLKNFEVLVAGQTTGTDKKKDADQLQPMIKTGATWWSEGLSAWRGKREELEARIQSGPPDI